MTAVLWRMGDPFADLREALCAEVGATVVTVEADVFRFKPRWMIHATVGDPVPAADAPNWVRFDVMWVATPCGVGADAPPADNVWFRSGPLAAVLSDVDADVGGMSSDGPLLDEAVWPPPGHPDRFCGARDCPRRSR